MLNCEKATRLLSESQDRTLSPRECMSLKVHISMCSGCQNFGRHLFVLREVARTYAKSEK